MNVCINSCYRLVYIPDCLYKGLGFFHLNRALFRYTITLIQDSKHYDFQHSGAGCCVLTRCKINIFENLHCSRSLFYLSEDVTHCMVRNAVLAERSFRQLF